MRITLTGGEALLYPKIEETLSIINGLDLGVRIFSNGFLNSEIYKKLQGYKIDTFFLSMDGLEDHHDFLRGKRSYRQAEKALAVLCSINTIGAVTISTSLDRENASNFSALLDIAAQFGIRTLLLRPLMEYPWTNGVHSYAFRDKLELLQRLEEIEELSARRNIECQINKIPFMPLNKATFYEDHEHNSSIWYALGLDESIDCVGGNLVCGVRYDGIVSPCGFINLKYNEDLSNSIFHRSLLELWHHASNLGRLRYIKCNTACGTCFVNSICRGGCRANSYIAENSISSIDPYCLYHSTKYGPAVQPLSSEKIGRKDRFPIADEVFYVSRERLVTKCGWATYA